MTAETKSPRIDSSAPSWLGGASALAPALAIVLALAVGDDGGAPPARAAGTGAPQLPAPPADGELGFVVVKFHTPAYIGKPAEDCPDGMMGVLRDQYLATQPAAERARLEQKENEAELKRKWIAYGSGPNGTNVCSNVREFPNMPPTHMNKSKIGWGLNLDGDEQGGKDDYTCAHDNFTSPSGEKGIDHQFWRVQGCAAGYRGPGDNGYGESQLNMDYLMMTGETTQVILLRGVDSLVDDPKVDVVYANTDDRPIVDSKGAPIFRASYSVATHAKNAEYRNVLHGRIVNGVLTTDTSDILLKANRYDFDLARGKLRLEFQPDGTVKGMVGGYQPLLNILSLARAGGMGSVATAGINCAGIYSALRQMADGARDPKTGQCSKISYAYELTGIPAFVNDAPAGKMAAK